VDSVSPHEKENPFSSVCCLLTGEIFIYDMMADLLLAASEIKSAAGNMALFNCYET
jgi:hypothetical protein